MQSNISRSSPQANNLSGLNNSNSFKRLGNSIISKGSLNSLTVRQVKEMNSQAIPSPVPQLATPQIKKASKSFVSDPSALQYLKREITAKYPPADYKYSVFAIYDNGNSYDNRKRSYGMPRGIGILLNEHMCLTASSVLPDESTAISSFMQFKEGSTFRFDPYRAFVTVYENFALCAFKVEESSVLEKFKPMDIKRQFELSENDPVFYFPFDTTRSKTVLVISDEYFTFTTGLKEFIIPGNPIFTVDWVLQGIYVSSDGHINKAIKLNQVFDYLENSIPLMHNPIIEKFLNQDKEDYVEKFHDRHLFYFEWGSCNIWRYDLDQKTWSTVKIHNISEFSEDHPLWSIPENSRLVYLPSSSIVCIGGTSKSTSIESRDVFEFAPQEYHTLKKLPDLIVPRSGAVCLHIDNYIYALGGSPHAKTCEKYSVISRKWLPLSSMFYPRLNSSGTSALGNEYIFVFGGEPLSPAGTSIEKYSVRFNRWELLSINLPLPLSKIAVFPITNRRIALLGGSETNNVFILNINDTLSFDGLNYTTQDQKETYTLKDCPRPLDNVTETVFPVALSRTHNLLYIMNSYKSTPDSLSFSIEEYNVEYFEISTMVDYSNKPLNIIAKVRTPYDLGRTWKNDMKLRMLK